MSAIAVAGAGRDNPEVQPVSACPARRAATACSGVPPRSSTASTIAVAFCLLILYARSVVSSPNADTVAGIAVVLGADATGSPLPHETRPTASTPVLIAMTRFFNFIDPPGSVTDFVDEPAVAVSYDRDPHCGVGL